MMIKQKKKLISPITNESADSKSKKPPNNGRILYKGIGILGFLMILFILWGCNAYAPANKTNISASYNPKQSKLHPQVALFHQSKDSTILLIKQARKELKYDEEFTAKLQLQLDILENYESAEVIDSLSFIIYDTLDGTKGNYLNIKKQFRLLSGSDYVIKLVFKDLQQDVLYTAYHYTKKDNAYERDFFWVEDSKGDFRYSPIIKPKDSIKIHYKYAGKLFVRYFDKTYNTPRPPYLNQKRGNTFFTTDSLFVLPISKGKTKLMAFSKPGIYHIQADTTTSQGLTVKIFDPPYPEVKSPGDLIPPLKYIAQEREYEALKQSSEPKNAVDKFWLNISGNPARAKQLIRNYYSRVEQANSLFYTHKPGWQTERGMVYIVIGPPRLVYRSNNGETWIYGESAQYNALTLNFTKVNNPFSEQDYSLDRSPSLKDEWFFHIDIWRR